MSAKQLRAVIRRRIHKERAQPSSRKHMGLLEKKKDYKQRARDYHKKQDTIRSLKEKASMRNPDEFYFGMTSTRTKNGVHVKERRKSHTAEALRIARRQDVVYLQHKKAAEEKKIEALQGELHGLEAKAENKHTVFVDSVEAARSFDPVKHFDTVPELLHRASNRVRKRDVEELANKHLSVSNKQARKLEKQRQAAYRELHERVERSKKIADMANSIQKQRNLMGKGRRSKIVTVDEFGEEVPSKTVFKWKLERKR